MSGDMRGHPVRITPGIFHLIADSSSSYFQTKGLEVHEAMIYKCNVNWFVVHENAANRYPARWAIWYLM
jgi:hypothetical protein